MKTHLSPYRTLGAMLAVSFTIMYGVMFLNVDDVHHIYFSYTRTYMTLLMVAPMAVSMLLFMRKMYPDKRLNLIIAASSVAVFALSLAALRNQWFVSDRQYMMAMIPHHSSAIMTSKNAAIEDYQVERLSDSIIESQQREIAKMKMLLEQIK